MSFQFRKIYCGCKLVFTSSLFLYYLLLGSQIIAQPLEKGKRNTAIWFEQQFFTDTITNPHWFLETQVRYSTLQNDNNRLSSSFPFYRLQIMIGKLWILNQNWSSGISLRPAFEKNRELLFSRAFLQHTGNLKKLRLIKRLDFEHISDSQNPTFYWARTSGFIEIERFFQLKNKSILTSLSYQFFLNHRSQGNPIPLENERFVDRTRFRFNLGLPFNKWLLSLFLMRETDYFFAQEVFDESGELKKPFRKLNLFTPTYGLGLRYIWKKESE